jgi:hypothetical protein
MAYAVTQPYAQPAYTQPCLLWCVCCRDFVLDGDPSPLFQAACGIMKLQHMFGLIPRLQVRGAGAGNCAGCSHTCHHDSVIMYLLDATHVLNGCAPKVVPTGGQRGGCMLWLRSTRHVVAHCPQVHACCRSCQLKCGCWATALPLRVSFVGDCCWPLPAEHQVLPKPVHT